MYYKLTCVCEYDLWFHQIIQTAPYGCQLCSALYWFSRQICPIVPATLTISITFSQGRKRLRTCIHCKFAGNCEKQINRHARPKPWLFNFTPGAGDFSSPLGCLRPRRNNLHWPQDCVKAPRSPGRILQQSGRRPDST